MTKTQFKKKITSLTGDINQYIDKETIRLFNSGAIDTTSYEDNYILPRIVLTAALKNLAFHYEPFSPKDKREVLNLKHF